LLPFIITAFNDCVVLIPPTTLQKGGLNEAYVLGLKGLTIVGKFFMQIISRSRISRYFSFPGRAWECHSRGSASWFCWVSWGQTNLQFCWKRQEAQAAAPLPTW